MISSAAGASDSNSWHYVAAYKCFDIDIVAMSFELEDDAADKSEFGCDCVESGWEKPILDWQYWTLHWVYNTLAAG